ncbi:type II secretion system major pseudopilin GspG [soil metagenome]
MRQAGTYGPFRDKPATLATTPAIAPKVTAAAPSPYLTSMRRTRRSPLRPGFTLIEVLVVVVIIAILASLVAPNVFRHVDTAKNVAAQAQISTLSAALDAYRLDNGRYPTTEQGLGALWQQPAADPKPSNWRGPYLRQPVPADPWGAPYVFRAPGEHSPTGFDLSSMGADGAVGGTGDNADITNWKQ